MPAFRLGTAKQGLNKLFGAQCLIWPSNAVSTGIAGRFIRSVAVLERGFLITTQVELIIPPFKLVVW